MHTQIINGKRVVFRDKIPAVFGWKLLTSMNRLSGALEQRRQEIMDKITAPLPDGFALIPGDQVIEIVQRVLPWADVVTLVRGAVSEWEFDGDLKTDTCCDDLDALSELFPILVQARSIFFGGDLSGEVAGGSTST